ncbi:unnamed protein product [Symbiodinium sp. CCMP2592]|nr:unnamed protein product [Symbiodinium sp. CCMP2592]
MLRLTTITVFLTCGIASGSECLDCAGDEIQLVQLKEVHSHQVGKSNANAATQEVELEGSENDPPLYCRDAEPQSPRDVSSGFVGDMRARMKPLDGDAIKDFTQVNLHWHLGAEHYSKGEYDIPVGKHLHYRHGVPEWDGHPLVPEGTQPGFFCNLRHYDDYLKPYDFQYCKHAKVGYTYEFHWVFSSAGPLEREFRIFNGLGQAFNRSKNPTAIVRGQVCRIINDERLRTEDQIEEDYNNFIEQWREPYLGDAVRYVGSTTGPSYNNEVCSPLQVNWHVDTKCCTLTAQTMDRTCQRMAELGLTTDLAPHGSRELVDRAYSSVVAYPLNDEDMRH